VSVVVLEVIPLVLLFGLEKKGFPEKGGGDKKRG